MRSTPAGAALAAVVAAADESVPSPWSGTVSALAVLGVSLLAWSVVLQVRARLRRPPRRDLGGDPHWPDDDHHH